MIPPRNVLRQGYDAAINEIDSARQPQRLTNAYYSQIGNAIFEAGWSALEHSEAARRGLRVSTRLQVVSAPMGTGKTSFTVAFITALVRLADSNPDMPKGCVFLVEQIPKAEDMFVDLSKLLPGKVAVWTRDHDVNCSTPLKVIPSKKFSVDDLENYPVAIVTHAFYRDRRGIRLATSSTTASARPARSQSWMSSPMTSCYSTSP
jgi:hypothetical protein